MSAFFQFGLQGEQLQNINFFFFFLFFLCCLFLEVLHYITSKAIHYDSLRHIEEKPVLKWVRRVIKRLRSCIKLFLFSNYYELYCFDFFLLLLLILWVTSVLCCVLLRKCLCNKYTFVTINIYFVKLFTYTNVTKKTQPNFNFHYWTFNTYYTKII